MSDAPHRPSAPSGARLPAASAAALAALLLASACGEGPAGPSGGVPGLPPTILGVSPEVLEGGRTAELRGLNLAGGAGERSVTVGPAAAEVLRASPTSLTVHLPGAGEVECAPTRAVTVSVRVGGRGDSTRHPLSVAPRVTLDSGEVAAAYGAERAGCSEFPAGEVRYLLSVFSARTDPTEATSFRLRGRTGRAVDSAGASAALSPRRGGDAGARGGADRTPAPAAGVRDPGLAAVLRSRERHLEMLGRNREILADAAPSLPPVRGAGPAVRAQEAENPPPEEGSLVNLRMPDLQSASLCSGALRITGRVVEVTEHAVVVEDTTAPLAGEIDGRYREMAAELESRSWPILRENFGDPLAYGPQLDADGHVYLLFSPEVNDFAGILAFVFTGDFLPREGPGATCPASNEAEILYAQVPTRRGDDLSVETPAGWQRVYRSTLIHEMKHVTSNAERLARGAESFEARWLEEATAQVAEELYARDVFGFGAGGNTGFAPLRCQVLPAEPGCGGRPLVLSSHFTFLARYLAAPQLHSPLGAASVADASFYGSGWWLLRWTLDHADRSEASFLSALTQEPDLTGVPNLETRAGRPLEELLGPWLLSLAADDRPGTDPPRAVTVPSWDTRDVFRGLHEALGGERPEFSDPYPLSVEELGYGDYVFSVPGVHGGSGVILRLDGRAGTSQLLQAVSPADGRPLPELRMSAVRLR